MEQKVRYITYSKTRKKIHGGLGLHNVAPETSDKKWVLYDTRGASQSTFMSPACHGI